MPLNPFRSAISLDAPHTDDWYQGRSVYGGLIFAQIAHAVKQYSTLPIRHLNIDICAPVLVGDCTIQVVNARKGVNSHFMYVALLQNEKVAAHGTVICGGARCSDFDIHQFIPPESTPPQSPPLPKNPMMPAFTQHFEYWPTIGSLPFSQSKDLRCGGWIGSRHDNLIDDEMILALLDAWWPSLILAIPKPRPMGTISFSVDISVTEPFEQTEPCLIENNSLEIQDGYSIERNMLWSADGRLLACAQQNVVIIR